MNIKVKTCLVYNNLRVIPGDNVVLVLTDGTRLIGRIKSIQEQARITIHLHTIQTICSSRVKNVIGNTVSIKISDIMELYLDQM